MIRTIIANACAQDGRPRAVAFAQMVMALAGVRGAMRVAAVLSGADLSGCQSAHHRRV